MSNEAHRILGWSSRLGKGHLRSELLQCFARPLLSNQNCVCSVCWTSGGLRTPSAQSLDEFSKITYDSQSPSDAPRMAGDHVVYVGKFLHSLLNKRERHPVFNFRALGAEVICHSTGTTLNCTEIDEPRTDRRSLRRSRSR